MAYDEGSAELLREALGDLPFLEKRMFGGIAFMLNGNMVCGVHKKGGMFRIGKEADAQAQAIPGVGPMIFTGKPMAGFVECADEVIADDSARDETGRPVAGLQQNPARQVAKARAIG